MAAAFIEFASLHASIKSDSVAINPLFDGGEALAITACIASSLGDASVKIFSGSHSCAVAVILISKVVYQVSMAARRFYCDALPPHAAD